MIIAQHRGVSRRIAPSRPENWLFCIIMTSPSSPRFPFYPASLPLFAHATDSPNVHPLPLLLPPPSRLEISISGFSARFSGKISVITARTLDVQVSVERAPFPAGCVFLIGVRGLPRSYRFEGTILCDVDRPLIRVSKTRSSGEREKICGKRARGTILCERSS